MLDNCRNFPVFDNIVPRQKIVCDDRDPNGVYQAGELWLPDSPTIESTELKIWRIHVKNGGNKRLPLPIDGH